MTAPNPGGPYAGVPEQPVGSTQALTPEDQSYIRFKQEDRSLGEIASDLLSNATTLVKQEIALAKAETQQTATRAGKGIALLVGAGVAALLGLIALTLGIWWMLGNLIGGDGEPALGWSGLLTMLLWLIVAGILAMMGKSSLDKMKGLPRTTETVSKIPNAVTGNEEKNR